MALKKFTAQHAEEVEAYEARIAELEEELECSGGELAKDFERLKANYDEKLRRWDAKHAKEIEALSMN